LLFDDDGDGPTANASVVMGAASTNAVIARALDVALVLLAIADRTVL
jgi:hypothetical protein